MSSGTGRNVAPRGEEGGEGIPSASAGSAARLNEMKEAANVKYKAGDYEGAAEAYTTAIEAFPEASQLYSNRAAAFMVLKRYIEAAEDCRKAVELDPMAIKVYVRGAKAFVASGDLNSALEMLQTAHIRDPREESVRTERKNVAEIQRKLTLADGFVVSKEYDRALAFYNAIAEAMAGSFDLHLKRAEVLMKLKRFDEAYNLTTELMTGKKAAAGGSGDSKDSGISAAAAARPGDSKILVLRARILNLQGNTASAIKHLQEALRVDPDDATAGRLLKSIRRQDTLRNQGNDYFKTSKWKEAIEAYTECLALDPDNENPALTSKIYSNRAAAYLKLNKNREAFDDCTKCIELDDTSLKAYTRRAQAGAALGDFESLETCVRDFQKAKTLVPEGDRDTLRELEKGLKDAKARLKKAKRKDYYKILDVSKDANDDDLKKAYRKMCLKYHPDKNATAEEAEKAKAEAMFKDVSEAYTILSDSTKRAQYDAGATFNSGGEVDVTADEDGMFGGMGGMGGVHMGGGGMGIPPDLFEMLFASMGGGGMGGVHVGGMPGGMHGGMPGGFPGGMGGGMPRGGSRRR